MCTSNKQPDLYYKLMTDALKTVYEFLYVINMNTLEIKVLFARDEYKPFLQKFHTFPEIKEYYAEHMVLPIHKKVFLEFADETKFAERAKLHKAFSLEYEVRGEGWVRLTAMPARYNEEGNVEYIVISKTIINDQIKRRTTLTYLSETDALTGICNRYQGMRRMQTVCNNHEAGVFCYIDIDHFKDANDTCGHSVGDEVLKATANCLKETFPNEIVYRIGGDEFGFYLTGFYTPEDIEKMSQSLFQDFDKLNIPGLCSKVKRKLALSVGAVQYDGTEGVTPDDILLIADKRMYESKLVKGNHITYKDSGNNNFKSVLKKYKKAKIEVRERSAD